MGKGKMDQQGDKSFSQVKSSGARFAPMKGDVNKYAKMSATGMDKNFTNTKLSSARYGPVGSVNFVNNLLKDDIKWTPLKVIIAASIFVIPYCALIYILYSVSPMITGLMVGTTIVIFAFFYFLRLMTKDL